MKKRHDARCAFVGEFLGERLEVLVPETRDPGPAQAPELAHGIPEPDGKAHAESGHPGHAEIASALIPAEGREGFEAGNRMLGLARRMLLPHLLRDRGLAQIPQPDGIQAIDGLGELPGFDQTQRTAHLPLLRLLSAFRFRSRETPREALARLRAGARRGLGLAALGSGRGAALRIGLRRGVIVGRGRGSRRRGGARRRGAAAAGADPHLADRGKGTGDLARQPRNALLRLGGDRRRRLLRNHLRSIAGPLASSAS